VVRGLNNSATAECAIEITEIIGRLIKKANERASKN